MKNEEWGKLIYAAELNYCMGLGLIIATDEDMERDLERITRKYPGFFPGKKLEDGSVLYDDAQALAFVIGECPGIPKEYIQNWLHTISLSKNT